MRLEEIQAALREEKLDGWLFFDHHRRDPLAYRVLQFTPGSMVSRRWYYFVPAQGEPRGLVHKIESETLRELPGEMSHATPGGMKWSTDSRTSGRARRRSRCSIRRTAPIPYVAMVDAGTVELVRGLGVEIVTSANLVQFFEARWIERATGESSGSRTAHRPGARARRSSRSARSSAPASA